MMTKRNALLLAIFVFVAACSNEDRAYQTKDGKAFPFWHIKCFGAGASERQVLDALGEPAKKTQAGQVVEWHYWQVRQRESVDRIFGIIPITFRQDPEEVEAIIVFTSGRVSALRYRGPNWGCDREHDNDGNLIPSSST